MCDLTAIERDILKKEVSVGNQVLYELCKKYSLSNFCEKYQSFSKKEKNEIKDGLAAQLWLIGRAYAASPERRDYGEKINWKNSGNGLDTYFDLLAEHLCNNYQKFINCVNPLSKLGNYQFNKERVDIEILSNVIKGVIEFNKLLKEIRFSVDENELSAHVNKDCKKMQSLKDKQKNLISFSSKFLHFHFPNIVFIFDSITKSHFKGYGNPYEFKFNSETSEIRIYKSKNKNGTQEYLSVFEIQKELSLNELNSQEKEYAIHCIREYLLAKEINDFCKRNNSSDNIFKNKYIPRVIDTYMLIANSNM